MQARVGTLHSRKRYFQPCDPSMQQKSSYHVVHFQKLGLSAVLSITAVVRMQERVYCKNPFPSLQYKIPRKYHCYFVVILQSLGIKLVKANENVAELK